MSYKSKRYTKESKKRWLLARASSQTNKKDAYGHDKKRGLRASPSMPKLPEPKGDKK